MATFTAIKNSKQSRGALLGVIALLSYMVINVNKWVITAF